MKTSFDTLYQQLTTQVQTFETQRAVLRSKGIRNGAITAGVVMVAALLFLPSLGNMFWFIAFFALVIGAAVANSNTNELNGYYKHTIVPMILQSILPEAEYEPEAGISEATFCSCKLFAAPDRYSAEDLIAGRVGKTDIRFSEVHAEERHVQSGKNGTRVYWTDIFRGFLFIADFHKDFSGQTILYRNSWFKLRFGDEKRVKLENNDFEGYFDVYSTDEIEARYILSTSMMERLTALNRRLGNGITVSFRDSNVYIAIPDSTNHFEASLWSPLTRETLEAEFRTINELVSIVDELNLNVRIWTKE